jgi:uncharacterized cupredoxin-like copper-binding protein
MGAALVAAVAVVVLVAAFVAGSLSGHSSGPRPTSARSMNAAVSPSSPRSPSESTRAVPKLPGAVVNVSLTDSGGPMGEGDGTLHAGAMGLRTDRASVPHGTVSFLVTNAGSVSHEMVVLPLAGSQAAGTRPFGADAKVDEAGSLGEASNSGGQGAGEGIAPGASSWVTLNLAPGRYELVCNRPGHYVSGMFGQITVT